MILLIRRLEYPNAPYKKNLNSIMILLIPNQNNNNNHLHSFKFHYDSINSG